MKVVIVAKTRMGGGACIGGITFDGRSVRLIAHDAATNDHFNVEYNVGDVWDIESVPDENIIPPHIENVIVYSKRRLPSINNVETFILSHMPPRQGGIEVLYEGLAQTTTTGTLYIAEQCGVPPYSTMFWQPDRPLQRDDDAKRIRYRYPTPDRGRTLTFVGFQEPIEEIPAGALLRVSLAHWWRPEDRPDHELRCYVQLSGWFLDGDWESPVADVTSDKLQSPPVADTRAILKQVFGYDSFRPLQAEIIENVLSKRDTLAVMPTGSGKSLCYQLPALLFPGLSVVVSPLISLMEDQVMQLRELGVAAVFLNSTLSYDEYLYTTDRIRAGQVKLLYAAPETLLRPETLLLLEQCRVDCLTIDEAHCISEWGHDFRPEYRQLVEVRRRLPGAACLAVTATATERVRRDIKSSLRIADAGEFVASFNRENLFLAVEPKTVGLTQTLAFVEAHRGQSGIIYCATRRQVDTLAAQMTAHGWPALAYHAGLDDDTRRRHQRRFTYDDVALIVATIAFGMGINKSNVRFILHYDLPKNLESYYQQIGRAGRDGLPADCLLLFSYADAQTIRYFIMQQDPSQQPGARARLDAMLGFVETTLCRRRPLLAYFGDAYEDDSCDTCDNCRREEQEELDDLTIPSQKFLSCVRRTGEIFGVNHIIDVLRGSQSQKVLARGHDQLSTYNIGREFSKKEWQYLARQFIQQGLLAQDMDHGSLKLTAKAYAVFKGAPVQGTLPQQPAATARYQLGDKHDLALFERLRAKRKALADANNVPPYVVFSDRTLVEMATFFPQSQQAFAGMYGVGQAKLDKYAADFLPIIRDYCVEKEIEEKPKPAYTTQSPRLAPQSRTEEVASAYNAGYSVLEIAQDQGIKPGTVLNHLWRYVQTGRSLRPGNLLELSQLSHEEQQRVLDAFAQHGPERLRPVFDALGESVSYDELHLLRLHFVSQRPDSRLQ